MPILEIEDVKIFINEMKKIAGEEKSQYELIVAKQNGRIVFKPKVSTPRRNTLLLRDFTPDDIEAIKKSAEKLKKVDTMDVLNFWFDEKRDPPVSR